MAMSKVWFIVGLVVSEYYIAINATNIIRLHFILFAYRQSEQAPRSACQMGILFAGDCVEMYNRVFREQIAVGIELEIITGFIK